MSPKKSINSSAHQLWRGVVSPAMRPVKRTLPPVIVTNKLRKAIERLLPIEHHQRLRFYFETHGCLSCSRNNRIYGANGFCKPRIGTIEERLPKLDIELLTRLHAPPADLEETLLRPYRFTRQLFGDLVPTMGPRSSQAKPEPKSPPKIYIKCLN